MGEWPCLLRDYNASASHWCMWRPWVWYCRGALSFWWLLVGEQNVVSINCFNKYGDSSNWLLSRSVYKHYTTSIHRMLGVNIYVHYGWSFIVHGQLDLYGLWMGRDKGNALIVFLRFIATLSKASDAYAVRPTTLAPRHHVLEVSSLVLFVPV